MGLAREDVSKDYNKIDLLIDISNVNINKLGVLQFSRLSCDGKLTLSY